MLLAEPALLDDVQLADGLGEKATHLPVEVVTIQALVDNAVILPWYTLMGPDPIPPYTLPHIFCKSGPLHLFLRICGNPSAIGSLSVNSVS